MKKKCRQCGQAFAPRERQQYCSRRCASRANIAKVLREVLQENGRRTAAGLPREHFQKIGRLGAQWKKRS